MSALRVTPHYWRCFITISRIFVTSVPMLFRACRVFTMDITITVFWLVSSIRGAAAFSYTETQVILALFDYFNSDYLDILDENLEPSFTTNTSRNLVMTAVLTPEEVVARLKSFSGMTLVAARADRTAWPRFVQLTNKSTMRAAKWVLFSSKIGDVNDIYIPFDCQFLLVDMKGALPMMTEVYQIEKGGQLQSSHFGYWDPESGLSAPKNNFYTRRPDFKGSTFTAIIQSLPPYTYITQSENGSVEFDGYFYQIWKELETRLKFKTDFRILGQNEDVGLALANGNFEFAVLPVVQEPKITTIVSLTEPIYEAKIYLFGNRPGSELEWDSYLKPFSTDTWLATLAWIVISAAALSILYYIAWSQQASEQESDYYLFSVRVCFETVFRAVCAQGSDITPRSISCRILFLAIYMTALVLTSAFSAALFSLLTIPVSRAPFNSFHEVISRNNYKIGIILESDIYKGIKDLSERFTDSAQSKLFKMIEPPPKLPIRVQDGLERVCNQKDYIFMWDLPNVLEVMRDMNRTCQEKIMPGGPLLFKENLGFATVLDSPYKELIDLQLVRLKNEGVLRRLLLNTWPPHIPNVQSSWVRVTLGDISPILYMFASGAFIGSIVLLFEQLYWRFRGKRRNASRAIAERIDSASRLLRNIRSNLENSSVDPWATKYTDWESNGNLHRRPRDKAHYQ